MKESNEDIQKLWQELASMSDDSMRRRLEQQQLLNIEGWKFWLLTLESYSHSSSSPRSLEVFFFMSISWLNNQLPLESCRMGLKMVVERGGDNVGTQLNKALEGCPWTNAVS